MPLKTVKVSEPGDGTRQRTLVEAETVVLDFTITWSTNTPTAADAQTIADGAVLGEQTTNPAEVGIAIASIVAKLNLILAALKQHGIIAAS